MDGNYNIFCEHRELFLFFFFFMKQNILVCRQDIQLRLDIIVVHISDLHIYLFVQYSVQSGKQRQGGSDIEAINSRRSLTRLPPTHMTSELEPSTEPINMGLRRAEALLDNITHVLQSIERAAPQRQVAPS